MMENLYFGVVASAVLMMALAPGFIVWLSVKDRK
ncbi:hypothetical protein EVB62_027 [Rhizobium phage RHph_TM33]|uniref:Uncharacterized protein n=1 Tax=Rhizobium phage RHph_TM33 TaxID=2509765 RepID=A0A7S5RAA6_9CAUD|nr:hypothetical protein EVB62_027 [Rhizobium phage RHph_TM33]QIG68485.1 hypothetical protein EVB63_026 [Rhizobium phage RHph_TM38]